MSLNNRIKEARKNKGITQEQLGALIGVAKTTIAGYEKNREPTAAKVGEIADALGVDVNFLFQDEMKTNSVSADVDQIVLPEKAKLLDKIEQLNEIGCEKASTYIDGFIDNPIYLNVVAAEDAAQQDRA